MFLKSSKQAYAKLIQSRQALSLQSMVTAQAAKPILCNSKFAYLTTTSARKQTSVMGSVAMRAFSGNLPEHIVLEMPNLSPTMEKVRRLVIGHKCFQRQII